MAKRAIWKGSKRGNSHDFQTRMIKETTLRVTPGEAADIKLLTSLAAASLGVDASSVNDIRIVRRSIDARQRHIWVNLTILAAVGEDRKVMPLFSPVIFHDVPSDAPQIVIVGAGPAGLCAALRALELGIRPVVVERGHDVDTRRMDITSLCRSGIVNPESNYCFGEGGAGTFSDGKLFTRSKKRGNANDILQLLHQHGASESILVDTHAHIGSDRLPNVIKAIRETIRRHGGQVLFATRMSRLIINHGRVEGIQTADGNEIKGPVILACGHSARDVYRMLHKSGIRLESKGFAMGVRLEHPQRLIDSIQYHSPQGRGQYLPAAEYSMACQAEGRGVYSFCMCPGGVIVPAVSAEGEAVVNGMSASARAGRWANSGMVVEIRPEDFPQYSHFGPLSLMEMQAETERRFFQASGNTLNAPAQRMKDFTEDRISVDLPASSYVCGLHSADLSALLPRFVATRLKEGFRKFGQRYKGFLTNEACMIGLESRTSSPVRIPRDKDTLHHPDHEGLYPAGEGAGYAGGIVSAALDGRRCAEAAVAMLKENTSDQDDKQ